MIRPADASKPLLWLAVFLPLLASCDRQSAQAQFEPGSIDEVQALIEATKQNPSLVPGSKSAGAAVHVDPYPHSAGMSHKAGH